MRCAHGTACQRVGICEGLPCCRRHTLWHAAPRHWRVATHSALSARTRQWRRRRCLQHRYGFHPSAALRLIPYSYHRAFSLFDSQHQESCAPAAHALPCDDWVDLSRTPSAECPRELVETLLVHVMGLQEPLLPLDPEELGLGSRLHRRCKKKHTKAPRRPAGLCA